MKTIILNQRKERDELMSCPYLIRRSSHDTELLLSSNLIKLITGSRRVVNLQGIIDVTEHYKITTIFDNYQIYRYL